MPADPVRRAQRLAEEVLLPEAAAVDRADRVPDAHLAALDAAGLTGLAASAPDLPTRVGVTEALAGGCLATAFLWLQHQGALSAVAASDGPAASAAPRLASGALRAGVAITALHGPAPLALRRGPDGATLHGRVPWATGIGIVDVLRVAAIDEHGDVASVLVDAVPGPTLRAKPLAVVAGGAARTCALELVAHPAPSDRTIGVVPQAVWWAADAAGLAGNGALPLGVAGRAAALAGSAALMDAVDRARDGLLAADPAGLPAARAACSALAVRAAAALAVHDGGRGLAPGAHAERLVREAQFLAVFGSRPAIREHLLRTLGA